MSVLSEFFLHSRPSVVYLECIELSHSGFSTTFRLVRNSTSPISVLHEGAVGPFTYEYVPMRIRALGSSTDLDQEMEITIGDVGEIIVQELALVTAANKLYEKPIARYRCWRSDDLSAPIFGPVKLRIDTLSMTKEGVSFRAKAASYNIVRTGETYRVELFPMLEAML